MWTNPGYRELTGRQPPGRDEAQAEAPDPSSELLARFPRKGPRGSEREPRLVLEQFNGHDDFGRRHDHDRVDPQRRTR